MDLAERVERLEAELARQRERGLANEILANLFSARLLDISELVGDPMDLDAVLLRLAATWKKRSPRRARPLRPDPGNASMPSRRQ